MSLKLVLTTCCLGVALALTAACSSPAAPATTAPKATAAAATKAATAAPAATTAAATKAAASPAAASKTAASPAAGVPADSALKVTGKVGSPIGWSEEAVKKMTVIKVQSKNKQGETVDYEGVLIKDLLTLAKPAADASKIVFVADDGFTAETSLSDVMNCSNCIVQFRNKGGFSTVLPDAASNLQVKGVVELQVK